MISDVDATSGPIPAPAARHIGNCAFPEDSESSQALDYPVANSVSY